MADFLLVLRYPDSPHRASFFPGFLNRSTWQSPRHGHITILVARLSRVGRLRNERARLWRVGLRMRRSVPFMRHVLSALVQNQPGVLAQVSGMLASRNFNIDSLAVGETEKPDLSRMTFVVHGDDAELEQVRKQLDKIVTVVRVMDISVENFVERDLMLIKVRAN